jgi:hypothetical protein
LVTFREVLLELLDLPGATYSCVADRATGALLDEVGTSSVAPTAVVELGGSAAGFLGIVAGDGMDDLMLTSHRSYHLVRPVVADSRQPLMIYLCLDRGRSNLAAARRELAAPALHKRLAVASVGPAANPAPAPEPVVRRSVPAALPTPRHAFSPAVALLSRPSESPPTEALRTEPVRTEAVRTEAVRTEAVRPVEAIDPPTGRFTVTAMPLPRRSGPSRVPAALPTEPGPTVQASTGQSWATDVSTMRRLLAGLRALR